jgi:PEGA domain
MKHSKFLFVIVAAVVCAMASATDASAQRRSGGGRPSAGTAAPRGGGSRIVGGSRGVVVSPRVIVGAPFRSYYYPYFRPGFSIGFYAGYPYYPYGYYPYGYYPYASYGYGYGYPGYYPPPVYDYAPPLAYGGSGYDVRPGGVGGVRVQDAPKNAQVFVDGNYAGVVDEFDGTFQHMDLAAGPHEVEIRIPGQQPRRYDVNVTAGQTLSLHVR